MRRFTTAVALGAASLALIGGAGAALAQSGKTQHDRMIEVPPGAVVIVLPGTAAQAMSWSGPTFDAGFPLVVMPGPQALIRQIDQQMRQMTAEMQGAFAGPARGMPGWASPDRIIRAELGGIPPGVSGVVVTSFSDGHGTCTQRVIYSGNGATPKVQVSDTGGACASRAAPTASPDLRPNPEALAHTVQAKYEAPIASHALTRPLELAELSR